MKKIINRLRNSLRFFFSGTKSIIKGCFRQALIFSFLYSFIYFVIVDSVMDLALKVGLRAAGVSYLGQDNLWSVLLRPSSVLVIFAAAVMLTVISLFEIAGMMYACSLSRNRKPVTLSGMVHAGIRACIKTLMPKNWTCIPFILLLMPLTGVLALSGAAIYTEIPDFVMDFIKANPLYLAFFVLAFSGLILLELKYIFSLPYYLLSDCSFPEACRRSRRLIKRNTLYSAAGFLSILFIEYVAFMGLASVTSSLLLNPTGFLSGVNFSNRELEKIAEYLYNNFALISDILSPIVNNALLVFLFYSLLERSRSEMPAGNSKPVGRMACCCFSVILVLLIGFDAYTNRSNFGMLSAGPGKPEVGAHRGDSVRAPENTIPAFELAISEGADWIELDIHETKDGVIVVSHDDDLKRVSGKKQYVHDLTYAEIQEIDTGSWFSPYYSTLRLPTLDEVLKLCKGNVRLQIEIKPTKYDHELEEKLISLINENGMHDDVVIISLNQEPLKRIKELDPTMATGYCMVLAWGIIEDLDFADYFTIEEANVDATTVSNIHNAGKKCSVWTVNSEDGVQYLSDCNVDIIVTDDPVMMQNAINSANYSPLERFIRLYISRVTWGW